MAAKVLVVEDDAEFIQLLQLLLEKGGYLTLPAGSAATALRWLDDPAGKPDVVLLDLGLPGTMDGIALCKALKKNAATRSIPVLILTGRAENKARLEAALARADVVLHKPIDSKDLLDALSAVLAQPRFQKRGVIHRGGLELDAERGTVFFNGKTVHDLGPRLFDLLYLLVEEAPRALSARRIVDALRLQVRDSEIYVLVSRLRARLRSEFGTDLIATVPNKGYRLELAVRAGAPP